MAFWLVKSEPSTYSFNDLLRDGRTHWDGVRNYQARNHLRAMKKGDAALFYHSGDAKAVMGTAEIVKEAYPDPSATDGDWVMVDVRPLKAFAAPVTLAAIKSDKALAALPLIKQSRLSVMPVSEKEYSRLVKLGQ